MLEAIKLRAKERLIEISNAPGYYKWWASKEEFDFMLKKLDVNYENIKDAIETRNDLYCIYIGIAVKESVRERLNWHINDRHTTSQIKHGTLSTLRQSISSIVVQNQHDKKSTDDFINKLYVEYYYSKNKIKSDEAKKELHKAEVELLSEHLYILNIKDNAHPLAYSIKKKLKLLRKISK